MTAPVAIPIDDLDITDCDLCADHYAWTCPGCGGCLDHYQYPEYPIDHTCRCGTVSRITEDVAAAWAERFL